MQIIIVQINVKLEFHVKGNLKVINYVHIAP